MAERYTLDTSAPIAYLADEPGADRVERLLARAARQRVALFAATALLTDSRLVHKDPEFRPLADQVRLLELPMKPKRRG